MSYTPPPSNAVEFNGTSTLYVPPSNTIVEFNDTGGVAVTVIVPVVFTSV